jgi:hypothetical protein
LVTLAPASVALMLAMSVSSQARQSPPPSVPAGPLVDPAAARIRDEQRREMQLRGIEAEVANSKEMSVKAAVEQLNQDFKRIQVIRNDIARAVKAEGALDYKRVSDEAAEVKRRALRMQTYLALRGQEEEKEREGQTEYDDREMKDALVRLCKRIDSFVANPRFTAPDVVDVNGTAKAGRDLQEIIALSGAVRASAERLGQKNK